MRVLKILPVFTQNLIDWVLLPSIFDLGPRFLPELSKERLANQMTKTRVMIVEDEAIIRDELRNKIHDIGHKVVAISDTADGALKKAETTNPDLVLMDVKLKGEKDGVAAAEVIRELFSIPVIFVSAYSDEKKVKRAKQAIPYGYLVKPVQERELRITIEIALYMAKMHAEREKLITELQAAHDSIHILEGLLPICSCCKKIRDDQGYWNQIESYIEKHSEARFSHGICEECAEKLYGDTKWFQKRKRQNPGNHE